MPQSEEHLAVLDLIGVRRAVVALTRVDLVSGDEAELAALEVADRLEGTALAGAEIVPVAAPQGVGLGQLRHSLAALLGPAEDRDRPRLWVDRSFIIGGAGTVVTGTLVGGTLALGDTLEVLPGGIPVRVRGLQTHERVVQSIGPGNRAAVNLSGIDRSAVERGTMLGRPGEWRTTTRLLADLRAVRSLGDPITDRGSFHAHIGSGSHPARITLVEGDTLTASGAALITFEFPVVAAAGDHIILRVGGRRSVVAGGVILDPHPAPRRRDAAVAVAVLRLAADPCPPSPRLAVRRSAALRSPPTAVVTALRSAVISNAAAAIRIGRLSWSTHHRDNPLRPGMLYPPSPRHYGSRHWSWRRSLHYHQHWWLKAPQCAMPGSCPGWKGRDKRHGRRRAPLWSLRGLRHPAAVSWACRRRWCMR
jgi:selenocysteine-specific elongation factor